MASTEDGGPPPIQVEVYDIKVDGGSKSEKKYPIVSIDQVSCISELSSATGCQSSRGEHPSENTTENEVERIARDVLLSSRQRRCQRRQWNPSYHSSGTSFPVYRLQESDTFQNQLENLPKHEEELVPFSSSEGSRNPSHDRKLGEGGDKESIAKCSVEKEKNRNDESDVEVANADIESGGEISTKADGNASESSNETDEEEYASDGNDSSTSSHDSGSSQQTYRQNTFSHEASPDSEFESYPCLVDNAQDDRSLEIKLSSLKRPHMRAFHMAWVSFFFAFFTWFALTPLLGEVSNSLNLDHKQIWTSNTWGVAGSAFTRFISGPLCDKYGARWVMAGTLVVSAIPTALTGLVRDTTGLNILRLFIGVGGSSFVTAQYWTSTMFTVEVAGTANALVAGWGNLGGGVTQIIMGSVLFPLAKVIYAGDISSNLTEVENARASNLAWRTVCFVPAIICFIVCFMVLRYSDDSPKGNYRKRSKQGLIPKVSAVKSMIQAISDRNTWLLFVQYGCCFGVEITIFNAAALYFKEEFGQTTESAAAIASIFGWMNLFARGLGGFLSDMANARHGMPGRLWVQMVCLLLEGTLVILFGYVTHLGWAICVMIILSILVQAAEGSTYGIVPYIKHNVTGSVAGIIGAGGNVGGVCFSLFFREAEWRVGFLIMGSIAMAGALCSFFLVIEGHKGIFAGSESQDVLQRRNDHNEEFGSVPNVSVQRKSRHKKRDVGISRP